MNPVLQPGLLGFPPPVSLLVLFLQTGMPFRWTNVAEVLPVPLCSSMMISQGISCAFLMGAFRFLALWEFFSMMQFTNLDIVGDSLFYT